MKLILYMIFLILWIPAVLFSQKKNTVVIETGNVLRKNGIYLFCKGTRAKLPIIAKEFNWADTNITHVGIGIFEKYQLVVYNVVNTSRSTALAKESFSSFINGNDVSYCSIWEMQNSKRELKRLQKYLKLVQLTVIQFDFLFDLNNDDTVLYCSEFCRQALQKLNPAKYFFHPRQIQLNNTFYEKILNRKTLTYIPVDFFETNSFFKKIYEKNFLEK